MHPKSQEHNYFTLEPIMSRLCQNPKIISHHVTCDKPCNSSKMIPICYHIFVRPSNEGWWDGQIMHLYIKIICGAPIWILPNLNQKGQVKLTCSRKFEHFCECCNQCRCGGTFGTNGIYWIHTKYKNKMFTGGAMQSDKLGVHFASFIQKNYNLEISISFFLG